MKPNGIRPLALVWKPLSAFGPDAPLYPDGLLDLLRRPLEAAP